METLTLSIGVGILLGFFLWEKTGLQPGGWVVPGYAALFLRKPWLLAALVLSSVLTLLIYRVSESRFLSFGQRKTAFVFILSILISLMINRLAEISFGNMSDFEYKTIGHIVPGLVVLSAERQGMVKTFSAILVCSILVRFFLIFALGEVLVL